MQAVVAQTTKFLKIFIFPHISYFHNKITKQIFLQRLPRSEIFSRAILVLVLTRLTYNYNKVDIICLAKLFFKSEFLRFRTKDRKKNCRIVGGGIRKKKYVMSSCIVYSHTMLDICHMSGLGVGNRWALSTVCTAVLQRIPEKPW